MIRRAGSMLRLNDSLTLGEAPDTAKVPVVSAEPSFNHRFDSSLKTNTVWQASPSQLFAEGKAITEQAQGSLAADGQAVEISGDNSEYGDQFISAPIPVKKDTDYVMRISARRLAGTMAINVTSLDRRIRLAPAFILAPKAGAQKPEDLDESGEDYTPDSAADEQMRTFDMPFASGNRGQVLLVVSNNGRARQLPAAQVGAAELFEAGPTSYSWLRYVRPVIRAIQRNLFRTEIMLPLAVAGAAALALAGRRRELLILLAVPAYYLCFQSALYTEYRYILAIHYFLFAIAAVALYLAGSAIGQGSNIAYRYIRRRK